MRIVHACITNLKKLNKKKIKSPRGNLRPHVPGFQISYPKETFFLLFLQNILKNVFDFEKRIIQPIGNLSLLYNLLDFSPTRLLKNHPDNSPVTHIYTSSSPHLSPESLHTFSLEANNFQNEPKHINLHISSNQTSKTEPIRYPIPDG